MDLSMYDRLNIAENGKASRLATRDPADRGDGGDGDGDELGGGGTCRRRRC